MTYASTGIKIKFAISGMNGLIPPGSGAAAAAGAAAGASLLAPAGALVFSTRLAMVLGIFLPFEIYNFLEHFVARGDDARIRLEAGLRGGQVREFIAQIHVRHVERLRFDMAGATGAGHGRGQRVAAERGRFAQVAGKII